MRKQSLIKIGIVDDHVFLREGIIKLLQSKQDTYTVTLNAFSGEDFIEKIQLLNIDSIPDIIIVDVNMPGYNGFELVKFLKKNFHDVKIMVLTMYDNEETIIRMLRLGVNTYLTKTVDPIEFFIALEAIISQGYYYPATISHILANYIANETIESNDKHARGSVHAIWESLGERERKFIKLACTEMTYSQIAKIMNLTPKTIDNLRNSLFEKFEVNSRVRLVLTAIKHQLISID